jgi:hypothetical protein
LATSHLYSRLNKFLGFCRAELLNIVSFYLFPSIPIP